jgi:phosphatidylglycerol:prolipoprotein diacylglycerol transferase
VLPEIHIGPVTLQTFGLSFALAFIGAGGIALRRLREIGKPTDWAYEATFAALVGGLIGARVDWILQHLDQVADDPFGNVVSGTGLVFFGGLLGGAIGVVIWAWWRNFLGLTLLDLAAPAIAIGYAVGRVGCQLSGDGDYGTPWDGPWAMAYPDGTVPTDETVHPTPVYETLTMGLVALGLWHLRDKVKPGILMALYLLLAGIERFLVEFIRRNDEVALGLTQPQLISLAMILGGGLWILLAYRPRDRTVAAG